MHVEVKPRIPQMPTIYQEKCCIDSVIVHTCTYNYVTPSCSFQVAENLLSEGRHGEEEEEDEVGPMQVEATDTGKHT